MISRVSHRPFALCVVLCVLAVSRPAADQAPPKPGTKPATPQAVTAKPAAAPADIAVKTKYTTGAQVSENITYIKGTRQRVEFPGVTVIDQCELQQSVILNEAEKRYRIQPRRAEGTAPAAESSSSPKTGGVVTYATTLTDTLERKTVFGLEARRVKTVVVRQASAEACDRTPERVEIDAWYVNVPDRLQCAATAGPPPAASGKAPCVDRVESTVAGDVKLGFPVSMRTTTTTGEGDKLDVISNSMEVVDLQLTTLDAALFEIPKDYVEVKSGAEVLPSLAKGGSLSDALFGSTADGTSVAAPKAAGIVRIGVLEPLNRTTRDVSTRSLRDELVMMYRKAPYEALPLAGDSPAAIAQNAKRLGCDYILGTEVAEVKSAKPNAVGGMLRRVSGDQPPSMRHDVRIDFTLHAVDDIQKPLASGSGKAASGGFGVGSALRVAAFAGQTYMTVMGMGGMMGPLTSMSALGGGMGLMGGAGLFDPRMSAMSSMSQMAMGGQGAMGGGPGMAGSEDAGLPETLSTAVSNVSKATIEELRKAKR